MHISKTVIVCSVFLVGLFAFLFLWVPKMEWNIAFQTEFEFHPKYDHRQPLLVYSRLEALCHEYALADMHAQVAKRTITPGTTPGSEGEKTVMRDDAFERAANETLAWTLQRFSSARELAKSWGPLPEMFEDCEEFGISPDSRLKLITIEEE